MDIQYASDIHADMNRIEPKDLAASIILPSGAKTLIIAGDLSNDIKWSMEFLTVAEKHLNYENILFVPGNHEYYKRPATEVRAYIREFKHPKITILDDSEIEIDGVWFFGSTLWTNFRRGNPLEVLACSLRDEYGFTPILDFNYVYASDSPRRIATAEDMMQWNEMAETYINMFLYEREKSKKVVITHFLPSRECIHKKYRESPVNSFYASDHDDLLERAQAWIYGHSHDTVDFDRGACMVRNNPHGLPSFKDEARGFLRTKTITL